MSSGIPTSEAKEHAVVPGQIIAERYEVGEVLGEGGMGVVCAGRHVLLGTPVAIKLIHSELKRDEEVLQRFLNEARAAAALQSEHIARVFDAGQLPTGEPFLVMEQLDGVCLEQYLDSQGPLTPAEAVSIAKQVCEGLAEAHTAGLVHRDIKPANVFLASRAGGQRSAKILDFGIAKQPARHNQRGFTDPQKILGSPSYMSPEQMLAPASVDERADIWSVGVLLFELLTGQLPFQGETMAEISTAVLKTTPSPPSQLFPGISKELDAIVLSCLQKERKRRPHSATELAEALDLWLLRKLDEASAPEARALAEEHVSSTSHNSVTSLHDPHDLRPAPAGRRWLVASALLALSLGSLGAYTQYRQSASSSASFAFIHGELSGDVTLNPEPLGLVEPVEPSEQPLKRFQPIQRAHALAEQERVAPASSAMGIWPPPARSRARSNAMADANLSAAERYGL